MLVPQKNTQINRNIKVLMRRNNNNNLDYHVKKQNNVNYWRRKC